VKQGAAAPVVKHGLGTHVADGIAWLRLERPDAGNRVTLELAHALCAAVEEIELDDRIAVVVIAAAGASFCLGVEDGGEWERRADWVDAVGRLTRPVIAAIEGDAVAEGLELALACDLRLVSTGAAFAMPQLLGRRLPSHGGTQRLPRMVGRMRALDLLFTGRRVEATEAEAIGLASRLVTPEAFAEALDGLAEVLTSKGPLALRYAKEAVLKGSDLTLDQGIHLEEDLYVLLQTTQDRREGINAFLKRRQPAFKGK